jgi:peptidoglycan/LPS O-acetylase OafA/YrhL
MLQAATNPLPAECGSSSVARPRLLALDGLRGILALFVLFGHIGTWTQGTLKDNFLLTPGFRVPAFFALSGFVLYLSRGERADSLRSTALGSYFKKRILRLIPAYYASLILSILVSSLVSLLARQGTSGEMDMQAALFPHLLFLQSWCPDLQTVINPPCWMLGYEWLLALLGFPLLLCLTRRCGWPFLILLTLLLQTPLGTAINRGFLPPGLTLAFVLGAYTGSLALQSKKDGGVHSSIVLVGLVGSAVLYTAFHIMTITSLLDVGRPLMDSVAGLTGALLCLYLYRVPQGRIARLLSTQPFQYLGRISYSLFLVHWSLLRYTWRLQTRLGWEDTLYGYALFILAIPLIIVASEGFFRLFEAPFLAAASQRGKDKEESEGLFAHLFVSITRSITSLWGRLQPARA